MKAHKRYRFTCKTRCVRVALEPTLTPPLPHLAVDDVGVELLRDNAEAPIKCILEEANGPYSGTKFACVGASRQNTRNGLSFRVDCNPFTDQVKSSLWLENQTLSTPILRSQMYAHGTWSVRHRDGHSAFELKQKRHLVVPMQCVAPCVSRRVSRGVFYFPWPTGSA